MSNDPTVYEPFTPVTDQWAKDVCKIGQRAECCRYLTMGRDGWSCQKHGVFRQHLDQRVADGTIGARGDNCAGRQAT